MPAHGRPNRFYSLIGCFGHLWRHWFAQLMLEVALHPALTQYQILVLHLYHLVTVEKDWSSLVYEWCHWLGKLLRNQLLANQVWSKPPRVENVRHNLWILGLLLGLSTEKPTCMNCVFTVSFGCNHSKQAFNLILLHYLFAWRCVAFVSHGIHHGTCISSVKMFCGMFLTV